MKKYTVGQDVGPLEPWPLDNPASDYKILDRTPQTSGRIDEGGAGYVTRFGIWRCTPGVFECTEQGDELMTILAGCCRITDLTTGEMHELNVGDSLFLKDGSRVVWDIREELTKVFFGCKPGGY